MLSSFLLMAWAFVFCAPKSLEVLPPPHTIGSAALGGPARQELRKAVHDKDPEVRRRAETLVEAIERREQTARLLSPRTVHLKLKDATLPQAIAEITKSTGFSIEIDDRTLESLRK